MRYLVAVIFAALSLNAVGQVNPNYNPDYDANGFINVNDIFGFLAAFGNAWDSEDVISGCTYSYAVEYNPLANDDDGSCIFLPDCAGVINGCSLIDECGTCDSDPSNDCVQDCNGDWGGIAALDECGVCDGNNSTCLDECGVPNGDNSTCLDECGVPNGDNSTCVTSCGNDIGHEGYDYSTVQIGNQCWFSENCRYLPAVSDSYTGSDTDPHYYVHGYEGSNVSDAVLHPNYSTYGVLYNHASAMVGDVCPSGWVVPSKDDFDELSDFLGGITVAGEHLKSQSGWTSNGNGTNSSGFTGLPGGYRTEYGGVFALEFKGLWWSATISVTDPDRAHLRDLDYFWNNFQPQVYRFGNAYSVRCLMNTSSISGCTSSTACNFDPTANTDDGSCIEVGDSCDDNDLNTTGDIIQPDCSCLGTLVVQFNCGDDVNHENYDYSTVLIGAQCWFSENCRYLPSVSPSSASSTTDPYFYVYDYQGTDVTLAKTTANYDTYGVLYNWPAFMTADICPSGWHIPSDGEWQTMEVSLGMSIADASSIGWRGSPVGDYMKSASGWDTLWDINGNGSNSSGFSALPGGTSWGGDFHVVGGAGNWWSSSEFELLVSWQRELSYASDTVIRSYIGKEIGCAARCVRD